MNRPDKKLSPCTTALKVVTQRADNYGTAEQNFKVIAGLWNVALQDKLAVPLTTTDVVHAMQLLKIARLRSDPNHIDSIVDIAGYAECNGILQNAGVSGDTGLDL